MCEKIIKNMFSFPKKLKNLEKNSFLECVKNHKIYFKKIKKNICFIENKKQCKKTFLNSKNIREVLLILIFLFKFFKFSNKSKFNKSKIQLIKNQKKWKKSKNAFLK